MVCYKDKTFCINADECGSECDRRLTKHDRLKAQELDLNIMLGEFKNDCKHFMPIIKSKDKKENK
ncbi:MAG: hypothetical protein WC179_06880 [Candidatus Cloacimonadaceae bacterium]|jgi:hypothetical protein